MHNLFRARNPRARSTVQTRSRARARARACVKNAPLPTKYEIRHSADYKASKGVVKKCGESKRLYTTGKLSFRYFGRANLGNFLRTARYTRAFGLSKLDDCDEEIIFRFLQFNAFKNVRNTNAFGNVMGSKMCVIQKNPVDSEIQER